MIWNCDGEEELEEEPVCFQLTLQEQKIFCSENEMTFLSVCPVSKMCQILCHHWKLLAEYPKIFNWHMMS